MQQRWLILGLMIVLLCHCGALVGQVVPSVIPAGKPLCTIAATHSTTTLNFQFPSYVQQNPMGYAPLCRMELKIERQLPVGVWMRADGATYRQVTNPGLAYFRFKVPLGK